MSVSFFDLDRGDLAAITMGEAADKLATGPVTGLREQQGTGKWGGQPGAQAFMGAYIDALNQIAATIDDLQKQTVDLAFSTHQISSDATETDTQAAQRLQTHWHNHQPSHAPDQTAPGATGLTTNPVSQ